jgi:hypothetical protein
MRHASGVDVDVDVTIDLESVQPVRRIHIHF